PNVEVNDGALEPCQLLGHGGKRRHQRSSSLSSSLPPVMGKCRPSFTISLSSLPTLKNGRRFAGTSTGCPVRGFRPEYGLYGRTVKLPKPRISIPSPRSSASVIASNTQFTTSSARALVSSLLLAIASMSSLLVMGNPPSLREGKKTKAQPSSLPPPQMGRQLPPQRRK